MLNQQAINIERNLRLVIKEDPYVGYYLYVYDLATGSLTHDHHYFQDQLNNLYGSALRRYGVKKEMFQDV
jgi:hypothetical protein